jgi:hypothetical protein
MAEIAELDALGSDVDRPALFGPGLMAKGAGPLVSAVRRALLQAVTVAFTAEALPGRKSAGFWEPAKPLSRAWSVSAAWRKWQVVQTTWPSSPGEVPGGRAEGARVPSLSGPGCTRRGCRFS